MLSCNPADRAPWLALSGLVLATALLARNLPTSFAFDRIFHTSIATLVCSGGAVIGLSKWLPRDDAALHRGKQLDTIPQRRLRILFIRLVSALCLRVEVLRQVVRHVQCSSFSWAPLLPFAFVLMDCGKSWRAKRLRLPAGSACPDPPARSARRLLWLPAVTLQLGLGGILALTSSAGHRSTVICPALLPYRWLVPLLQGLGSALDVFILYCIARFLLPHGTRGSRSPASGSASVGYAFLCSAVVLFIIGVVHVLIEHGHRSWILTIPRLYCWSLLKLDMLIAFTLLCALVCFLTFGITTTSMATTFTSIMTLTTTSTIYYTSSFPPRSSESAFLGICLVVLAFVAHVIVMLFSAESKYAGARVSDKRTQLLFCLAMVMLFFLVWAGKWTSYSGLTAYHPIDRLIYEAQSHHQSYADHATASKSLTQAVREYKKRYQRLPPPNFDQWYKFATAHNSVIIDDFDSIDRDLRPFFALSPEDIRRRTWELISNPKNDAAGLIIRNGTISIAPNVVPTHRWMMDGVTLMVGKFSQSLPDMDLAFNLNDEPRVAVRYEDIEQLRQASKTFGTDPYEHYGPFSADRAEQWADVPDNPNAETPLEELSLQHIFHRYGAVSCHPDSASRTQRLWNTGRLCVSCVYQHSLGAFLSNWTTAADVCHQPDLANLHGLYLSPAAFKATHELYPIFSQSKAHGFNDILYPSAWNYLDKSKYAPTEIYPDNDFSSKDDVLFWRGATSEGVSEGSGVWKGMVRQRVVLMANKNNSNSPPQPLLLPSKDPRKLEYKNVLSSKLTEILPTDVHLVQSIVRCAGRDCLKQEHEFRPLVPPSDFQSHWKYRYLLDMDGAAFSGRFLPFLQSKSLPFKMALFREWWDDRVTPWFHFVPLDLRGQGLWATYAYFRGVRGNLGKEVGQVEFPGHPRAAEDIAMQGREWANKVLRKEDMEIYFFRLLLEWARLTDDSRDACGFGGEINV